MEEVEVDAGLCGARRGGGPPAPVAAPRQAAVEACYMNDYLRQQAEPQPLLPQEAGGRCIPAARLGGTPDRRRGHTLHEFEVSITLLQHRSLEHCGIHLG